MKLNSFACHGFERLWKWPRYLCGSETPSRGQGTSTSRRGTSVTWAGEVSRCDSDVPRFRPPRRRCTWSNELCTSTKLNDFQTCKTVVKRKVYSQYNQKWSLCKFRKIHPGFYLFKRCIIFERLLKKHISTTLGRLTVTIRIWKRLFQDFAWLQRSDFLIRTRQKLTFRSIIG